MVTAVHSFASIDPHQAQRDHAFKANFWKTMTVVGFVATTAFAGVALAYIQYNAAQYFLIGLFALATLMSPAASLLKNIYDRSEEHRKLAAVEEGVIKELKRFRGMGPTAVRDSLRPLGVDVYQIKDPSQVKPLAARIEFWKKQPLELQKQMRPLRVQMGRKETDPTTLNFLRKEVLALTDEAHLCKVRAAFLAGLLTRPAFKGDLSDLCEVHHVPFEDRYLGKAFNDPLAERFLQFRNKQWMDRPSIASSSLADLTQRLFS